MPIDDAAKLKLIFDQKFGDVTAFGSADFNEHDILLFVTPDDAEEGSRTPTSEDIRF